MKTTFRLSISLALVLALVPAESQGVTRDQVIINAQSYATHVWSSTAANDTASCAPSYSSKFLDIYGIGGPHVGLPYKWGGFDTVAGFDSDIAQGLGAGSHSSDGVLSCVTGQDCSGFVSRTWELASKMGTWTIHQVSHEIGAASLLPGDALNKSSTHIYLFHKLAADGAPDVYEAAG
ncbi:MAG: hypothetical protein VX938_10850, partial [Myxococcota bacterium]|nr:hypothetical protein [Myxococcota bacterium]